MMVGKGEQDEEDSRKLGSGWSKAIPKVYTRKSENGNGSGGENSEESPKPGDNGNPDDDDDTDTDTEDHIGSDSEGNGDEDGGSPPDGDPHKDPLLKGGITIDGIGDD